MGERRVVKGSDVDVEVKREAGAEGATRPEKEGGRGASAALYSSNMAVVLLRGSG